MVVTAHSDMILSIPLLAITHLGITHLDITHLVTTHIMERDFMIHLATILIIATIHIILHLATTLFTAVIILPETITLYQVRQLATTGVQDNIT